MITKFEVFGITKSGKEVEIFFGQCKKTAFQTFDFYAKEKKLFNLKMVVINNNDIENKVYIEA